MNKHIIGAHPHTAGGMSLARKRRQPPIDVVKQRAAAFLLKRGIGHGPSGFESTVPSGLHRIHHK